MIRRVFTRRELVAESIAGPAELLEGSWPTDMPGRESLDDSLDARWEWIDRQAAQGAQRLAESPAADLNVLALRYYLVKLIRVVAWFAEARPMAAGQRIELTATPDRDEDYADLLGRLSAIRGAELSVRWNAGPASPSPACPPNPWWRRAAGCSARWLNPPIRRESPRVVLCGNPRHLAPVCRELAGLGGQPWWLADRFSPGLWLRWRPSGVGQVACDSSLGRENRLASPPLEPIDCLGIDLAGPVSRWLDEQIARHGAWQTRIGEQVEAHFRRLRPSAVLLDQDATPLARAVVAAARRCGARSAVLQHGAPCCRFGYSPLAADVFYAWGASSAEQLIHWGVPAQRISAPGSPAHEAMFGRLSRKCGPRLFGGASDAQGAGDGERLPRKILLLCTVPPRDGRPDALALHLTRATYAAMLRMAAAAVADVPEAELIVKLHPRAAADPLVREVLAAFPRLNARVVTGDLLAWLPAADCVLSCLSSAGIDAMLSGVPVIQLQAPGSGEILPAARWGLQGTARTDAELRLLLADALAGVRPAEGVDPHVFAEFDGQAAARIAADLLRGQSPARTCVPCDSDVASHKP